MSADEPDVYIDERAVALVDAKIKESQALTRGIMSSWASPLEGVTKGPMGDITPPKPIINVREETVRARPAIVPGIISIPSQAMKAFKRILDLCDHVDVRLTNEQKSMLLESVQAIRTPQNIMEAKAIFDLLEALQK